MVPRDKVDMTLGGEKKNPRPCHESSIGHSACKPVVVLTELS